MALVLPGLAVAERCRDTSCRTFSGAVSPDTFLAFIFSSSISSAHLCFLDDCQGGRFLYWLNLYLSDSALGLTRNSVAPRRHGWKKQLRVCVCWQGATSSPTSAIHRL